MNDSYLFGLIIGIFAFALVLGLNPAQTTPPPTPAFKFVNDSSSSISADNYSSTLFLTAGENMTLAYFSVNNTIRFSSADTGGGGGEVFTWTADHNANSNDLLNFGFIESDAVNVASAGEIRLGNTESIAWRDSGNTTDVDINYGADDVLYINSQKIEMNSGSTAQVNYRSQSLGKTAGGGVAQFSFKGLDSADAQETYGRIVAIIRDPTAANPDGSFRFDVDVAGTLTAFLEMNGLVGEVQITNADLDLDANDIQDIVRLKLNSLTDGTRGTCTSAENTVGTVIFNSGDDNLNICSSGGWILPDGTAT